VNVVVFACFPDGNQPLSLKVPPAVPPATPNHRPLITAPPAAATRPNYTHLSPVFAVNTRRPIGRCAVGQSKTWRDSLYRWDSYYWDRRDSLYKRESYEDGL